MVEGSQWRILQILLFSTLPNQQTTRLEPFDAHWNSYPWIPHLPTFCSYVLVVDGTVDWKDNKEEKTMDWQLGGDHQGVRWHKDASLCLEFLQLGRVLLWWCWLTGELYICTFFTSGRIKYMRVGGGRHCGQQGQQWGEDQGGCWHWDVTLSVEIVCN